MKIAIAASLLATASAFVPSQKNARPVTSVHATAELDSMLGVGPETGNKVVRATMIFMAWIGGVILRKK